VGLRVTHRDRRLVGKRGEQISVVAEILVARPLGAESKNPDQLAFLNLWNQNLGIDPIELGV
jgi:hypothetical protein